MTLRLPLPRTFPPITTGDIIAICAATGDTSPLHLDEAFAQANGHPTVVVPGTILLGWLSEYIEEATGLNFEALTWSARLTGPIRPGDCLTVETIACDLTPNGGFAGTIEVRADLSRVVGKAHYEVRPFGVRHD